MNCTSTRAYVSTRAYPLSGLGTCTTSKSTITSFDMFLASCFIMNCIILSNGNNQQQSTSSSGMKPNFG